MKFSIFHADIRMKLFAQMGNYNVTTVQKVVVMVVTNWHWGCRFISARKRNN
jgi:hypothetical protein